MALWIWNSFSAKILIMQENSPNNFSDFSIVGETQLAARAPVGSYLVNTSIWDTRSTIPSNARLTEWNYIFFPADFKALVCNGAQTSPAGQEDFENSISVVADTTLESSHDGAATTVGKERAFLSIHLLNWLIGHLIFY